MDDLVRRAFAGPNFDLTKAKAIKTKILDTAEWFAAWEKSVDEDPGLTEKNFLADATWVCGVDCLLCLRGRGLSFHLDVPPVILVSITLPTFEKTVDPPTHRQFEIVMLWTTELTYFQLPSIRHKSNNAHAPSLMEHRKRW